MLDSIANKIKDKIPVIRAKLTDFINNMIPDKDIEKTSILFFIIISFCVIAIIWGLIARIDSVVRAQGTVVPASKIQVVQSVYGGVLEEISAKLGDTVEKGDILFLINEEVAKAEFLSNETFYESTLLEVETREKKVSLIEDLVLQGAESEMRLLDEKLQLVDAQRRLAQASSKRQALKLTKEQSIIRSPVNGIISAVDVTTEGQVIDSGQILANVVPEGDKLIIEAQVQAQDISFVSIGQKAKLSLSAFDPGVYGSFEGVVKEVSASSRVYSEDQPPTYSAIIEITDERAEEINIQAGMTVDASIIGQKRSVIGYVFTPVSKLKRTAFREK